jgi:hypothetical protein
MVKKMRIWDPDELAENPKVSIGIKPAWLSGNSVSYHDGAPDLVTLPLDKEIAGPKNPPFSYLSGKNAPFSKLIKTTRPIFIYFKTGGDKIFRYT